MVVGGQPDIIVVNKQQKIDQEERTPQALLDLHPEEHNPTAENLSRSLVEGPMLEIGFTMPELHDGTYRQVLTHHVIPIGKHLIGNVFVFQHANEPKQT